MNHVVQIGDLAIGVTDHWEVHRGSLGFADIAFPLHVAFDRVNRETDDFDIALVEFGLDLGDIAKFGGAHRGEVFGVAEQHAP